MITLKAALEEATAAIGRVDAHVLVAHLLGVDRSYLLANPMRVLTESEDARIDTLVARSEEHTRLNSSHIQKSRMPSSA